MDIIAGMKTHPMAFFLRAAVLVLVVLLHGPTVRAEAPATQPTAARGPHATVIWISLDGMRHDYVDRYDVPYIKQLMTQGAFSRKLEPTFPSITFPNHSSQVTGVTCDQHGITDNQFRDTKSGKSYTFPNPQEVLTAEPIWTTAQRQGVRSATEDWPLSYSQTGPNAAAYFATSFVRGDKDEDRLGRLLTDWKNDRGPTPLRLLFGYVPPIDVMGHSAGPEATSNGGTLFTVDKLIRDFHEKAITQFKASAQPGDSLYLLLSTDHGMQSVTHHVNPKLLIADVRDDNVESIPSGPLMNISLDKIADASEREKRANAIVETMKKFDFVTGYTRKTMPAAWGYNHPSRSGDVILMLKNGYKFDLRGKDLVAAVASPGGTHGYPVESCPDMMGLLVIHRFPQPLGGKDLGVVNSLQLHPTVAKLLGIKPSEAAKGKAVELGGE